MADTAVGATALNGLIGQILHIAFLPMVRPDWWRDRFGGRALLIWSGYVGLGLLQPFVFAYMTGSKWLYTVIQLWSVLGQLLSCIDTSASGSFTMVPDHDSHPRMRLLACVSMWTCLVFDLVCAHQDCLPADEDCRPISAARDLNLLGWASQIPGTGFPLLLAGSFAWFPNHKLAFQVCADRGCVARNTELCIHNCVYARAVRQSVRERKAIEPFAAIDCFCAKTLFF
eukprot:SAG11_NODE_440_length_9448_cov_3.356509_7_plen_228_part_00